MSNTNKISFIVENERFPLSSSEKIVLGIVGVAIIAGSILFLTNTDFSLAKSILVLVLSTVIFGIVYVGMITSLLFHKIETGFVEEKNIDVILYALSKLNIKAYKDQSHNNVFVCFINKIDAMQREEIYIIAKKDRILITSNKEKKEDGPLEIDFVEKIGAAIFQMIHH